ncbi:DUF1376 domain-containing protein [Methylobacterium oxalidis]|uniref:DUF1376 domain-containing protein n=1 Tax=Methylobacterium oxalidis TaxID=944322 RepID=A0A512J944_9HYPH|nr:DUF1376 domain-containing protein [Methylobacterium oxalidis]GEP06435.1 hypothetical protein MOX02_44730 [Methylobacterium oxalidis]GJE33539.1 hypothetical protein LDDCCGHA_3739 [Methylobacterium oxalidis]GLS65475.1 hypothetical protein GCM10007888_38570 [Methylobacterium oxalidis]
MTAQSDLPAPLVPLETDIQGLPAFMLDVERLFASELWALSSGEEFKAAVALWGRAWQQIPAGSLPNDERLLAAFSGAGPRWRKVRDMALRGFVLCSDGRLYHRTLCADVLRAAKSKEERRQRTAAASKARRAKGDGGEPPPSGGKNVNENNETAHRNDGRHDHRNGARHDDRNEVRHEDRNDAPTMTSRTPLRVPIDRTGQNREENIPAAACDPVPREAAGPRPAWNTRENFDRIERRCRAALAGGGPQDLRIGPIAKLEVEGLDLEAEIIPALLDIEASARVPIRTWGVYADRVAERVTVQRQTQAAQGLRPVPAAPGLAEDLIDLGVHGRWPEETLRTAIERFRQTKFWAEGIFGPPPGEPRCRVPSRLLLEAA